MSARGSIRVAVQVKRRQGPPPSAAVSLMDEIVEAVRARIAQLLPEITQEVLREILEVGVSLSEPVDPAIGAPPAAGIDSPATEKTLEALKQIAPEHFDSPDNEATEVPFETPPANGAYQGPAPIRTIAPGVHGDEVDTLNVRHLVRGAIWQCGKHRVRIGTVDHRNVGFLQLGGLRARGLMPRALFLRQYRPE
jgi:hypothetical protein